MFGLNKSVPKQKKFGLTAEQVSEDIKTICRSEASRSLLFECVDAKAPEYKRIGEMREFLRGSEQLEEAQRKLQETRESLGRHGHELELSISKIHAKINCNNYTAL